MQRRAVLREVVEGTRTPGDVCDAHPDLVRAGEHLGASADEDCPLCGSDRLRHVTYVFFRKGPRKQGGRAVRHDTLPAQLKRHGDLNVYRVEVCVDCSWHHLLESFWLVRSKAAG